MRDDLPLGVPDTYALRRRVLLTAVVVLTLFFTISYVIAWLNIDDAWLLIAMVVMWFAVVRPMMKPVREAIALRRRLAYESYLSEKREHEQ